MANLLTTWAESAYLFWILWGIELAVMLVWLITDLRNTNMPMNPTVMWGFAYLMIALLLKISGANMAGMVMVGIGALPLALMAVFLLVILIANLFGPVRWN